MLSCSNIDWFLSQQSQPGGDGQMSQSTLKAPDMLWSSPGCPAQNGDSLLWR